MTFHHLGNFIIPTDEVIFFRGVELNHQAVKNQDLELSPKKNKKNDQ